ncbi:hypothetical protein ACFYUD_29080 [Nocardia tengchongensis]|uniref:hypothetical protein n=1 Tax=Nocardia tengchongensis TaxID=2055889 RepID=UPI0036822E95
MMPFAARHVPRVDDTGSATRPPSLDSDRDLLEVLDDELRHPLPCLIGDVAHRDRLDCLQSGCARATFDRSCSALYEQAPYAAYEDHRRVE